MQYKGLKLDKFQKDAIRAIDANKSVVVSAPTGSGKTLIADYIINRDIKKGVKVIYTAPIKALSNQKYKEFSQDYGKENVGLLTGDIVKNPKAPILIMTTEVYRNMVLSDDKMIEEISYVVFDEIHYINDIERGYVWEESIIFSKQHVRMLCLSATIPNAKEFARWIEAIKNHKVEVIKHTIRPVPLYAYFYDYELGITNLKRIKEVAEIPVYRGRRGRRYKTKPQEPSHIELVKNIRGKLPCIFFNFSRAGCQKKVMELSKEKLFKINSEITSFVRRKLANCVSEINKLDSTRILRQTLPYGIGFHHAGLLPIMKELVEELFSQGLIKVLYTTETFAVGINMPAKTVCFESLRKFDGINFRLLNSKEYFQIAGRAGRRGIDKEGFVYVMVNRRDFEYSKFRDITTADTMPIISQFRLSYNTVLNLIKQHNQKEIDEILCKSFDSFQKYGDDFNKVKNYKSHSTFLKLKKKLEKFGHIKNNKLTIKGEFASRIYADEIIISEIFATNFYKKLNDYQMLMLIAGICYEARERTRFYKLYRSKDIKYLKNIIKSETYISKEKRFRHLDQLTALIHPCYHGYSIFEAIDNTNLLEGDIIRLFRQILDRIGQVKQATQEKELINMLNNCNKRITDSMRDIDIL